MIWLVIKTLFTLIPLILNLIKEGKIKSAAQDEILAALESLIERKVNDALEAEKNLPDIATDPFNRAGVRRNKPKSD